MKPLADDTPQKDEQARIQRVDGKPPMSESPSPEPHSGSMTPSVLRLAAGRGAVIALGFVITPVLTRLYDPGDFGTLSLLTTIVALMEGFTSLSYARAMPLAVSIPRRRALFMLSAIVGVVGTLVMFGVFWLARGLLAALFKTPDLEDYALAIPWLYATLAFQIMTEVALGCEKKFGLVSIRNMISVGGTKILQVLAALVGLGMSPVGLLAGTVMGTLSGALTYSRAALRTLSTDGHARLRLADLKSVAVEYRKFPLFQAWSRTLEVATLGLPVLLVGFLFGEKSVGLYCMARNLVNLPVQLLTLASGDVFYVEAARAFARGESPAKPTIEILRLLAMLTAFPIAVVLVLGPLVFEVFLGPEWKEAGVYTQIMAPWIAISAVAAPLLAMFPTTNRQGEGFVYNAVMLVARVGGLFIGGWFVGARTGVGLMVVGSVVVWGHLFGRTLRLAQVRRRMAARMLFRAYSQAALLLVPSGVLYWAFDERIASLAALAAAAGIQAAILYRRNPGFLRQVKAAFAGGRAAESDRA